MHQTQLSQKSRTAVTYAEDMLIADRIDVRPGGKQPIMRDAVFNGQVQLMILPDG